MINNLQQKHTVGFMKRPPITDTIPRMLFFRYVHALFRRARKHNPSIIFIDEADSWLGPGRGNEPMNEFKSNFRREQQNEAVTDWILVIGATNAPWNMDIKLRRRYVWGEVP